MAESKKGDSEGPAVPPPVFSVTGPAKPATPAAQEEVPIAAPIFSVTAGVPPPSKDKIELPDAHDPVTGAGRWLYEAKLGEGGLAVVFQAWDTRGGLGQVAVKVLKRHSKAHARHAFAMHRESQWSIQRLHNTADERYSAEHAALFARYLEDHTGFVDLGPSDFEERRKEYESPKFDWSKNRIILPGKPYVVMELVRGETLQVAMDREYRPVRIHEQPSLSQTEKNDVILQCVMALEYLERFCLIHRDFRGCNMQLIARRKAEVQCQLKILDLGVMISAEVGNEENCNLAVQAFRRRGDTEEKRKRYDWLPWEVRSACDDIKGPVHNFDQPGHAFDAFSLGVLILHLVVGKTQARQVLDTLKDHPEETLDASSIGVPRELLQGLLSEAADRPRPSQVAKAMVPVKQRSDPPQAAKAASPEKPLAPAKTAVVVSSQSEGRAHETISHTTTKVEGTTSEQDEDEVVEVSQTKPTASPARDKAATVEATAPMPSEDSKVKASAKELKKKGRPKTSAETPARSQEKAAAEKSARGQSPSKASEVEASKKPKKKKKKGQATAAAASSPGRNRSPAQASPTKAPAKKPKRKGKSKEPDTPPPKRHKKNRAKTRPSKSREASSSRNPARPPKKADGSLTQNRAKAAEAALAAVESPSSSPKAEVHARSQSRSKQRQAKAEKSRSRVKPPQAKAERSRSRSKTPEAKAAKSRSRSREDSKTRKQRKRRERARALLADPVDQLAGEPQPPKDEIVEAPSKPPADESEANKVVSSHEAPTAPETSAPLPHPSVLEILRRQQEAEKKEEEERQKQREKRRKEQAAKEKMEQEKQAQQKQQMEAQQAWAQQAMQQQQQQMLAMQAENFFQPQAVQCGPFGPMMFGMPGVMHPAMMAQQPQGHNLPHPPPARSGQPLPQVIPGGVQKSAPPKPLAPRPASIQVVPRPAPEGAAGGMNGLSASDPRALMAAAAAQLLKQQQAAGGS